MFSPAGNRVPHPGWLHYDLDVDDQSTIACQLCPQRYGRREVMSTLLAHVMIVHSSSDCYRFKRATGFFGQERELLKLDQHHPGWKYFEAVNVACRACKKVQIHADVGRLLKHLQRAHPMSNFSDFRDAVSDLDGGSNAANVQRQVKEEKQEPVSEEDGGVGTLPVANNNDAVDDKSRIALIVSGEAKSSITPVAVLSTPLVGSVALPQSQIPSIPVAPAIPSVSAVPRQSPSIHVASASVEDAVDDKSRIALIVSGEAKSSTTPVAVLSTPLVGSVALPQSQIPSIPVAPAIPSVSAVPRQSPSIHVASASVEDAVDDKSRIALIVSGEAKSSTTPVAVLSTPLVGSVALPQSQIPSVPVAPAIPSVSAVPRQSPSIHVASASVEASSNSTLPPIQPTLQKDYPLPPNAGTAAPPTSPARLSSQSESETSESGESDVSEYNPTHRTGPKAKGQLTESLYQLHVVTDRMTRKWHYQKKMPLSAFKKPKGIIFYHSYWTNGCQKRYFKCGQPQCPFRMLAVNNKDWMKVFQYRHHSHAIDENSFSSCSTSASSSRTSSTSDSSSG